MDYATLTDELCQMRFDRMGEFSALNSALGACSGESGALLLLYRMRRPALSGELVDKMGLTSGRVANILRQLEEKGLIQRQADREDGRHVVVALTGEGHKAAQGQYADFLAAQRAQLEFLGPEDSQAFLRLTRRLLDYIAGQS